MAIPAILLALALMALMRGSVRNVIIALVIPEIPRVIATGARLGALPARAHDGGGGAGARRRARRASCCATSCPALVAPLIVQATYIGASAILFEAYLSFLGAGTPPHIPVVGQHHGRGQDLRAAGVLDHPLPGTVPGPDGAGHQPRRRRAARPARTCAAEAPRMDSASTAPRSSTRPSATARLACACTADRAPIPPGCAARWRRWPTRWACSLILYDHRGHGRSEWVAVEQCTQDQLGRRRRGRAAGRWASARVHVLGISWGGFLGLMYAARHPDHGHAGGGRRGGER